MTEINNRLLVMTAGGLNPNVMINALAARFPDIHVIVEQAESKSAILKRRARRLGWMTAAGQMATMIASRLGKRFTVRRTNEIIAEHGLSADLGQAVPVTHVASLNDEECHKAINILQPAAIFTISCRLLTPATLQALRCPVINFHAGINPAYRGQMGGYWALVEKDRGNFGATVHLVDKGVDTGATLYEKRLKPSPSDTIATYPLLLTAASVDIAVSAIEDALSGSLAPQPPLPGKSVLRFPPAIWTWLWNGLTKRVW
ncbi:formyl transferase [Agrobacterium tumefaciens]|uniref:formyl transferase n=1 Tax=Agrobacterium tumefaciens TaxID=358 RepID=UPI0015725624|nr:formyl transferase [Agrobacterium tumefaciens]NSZ63051.1 formyl transferase [Agrobacterium tumefaciens]NTA69421.1 formyl transferase [Agrobacterium tumefaciens]WIE39299.1 formyl transferase [Agrobacterium tumefaciens]